MYWGRRVKIIWFKEWVCSIFNWFRFYFSFISEKEVIHMKVECPVNPKVLGTIRIIPETREDKNTLEGLGLTKKGDTCQATVKKFVNGGHFIKIGKA